MDLKGRKLKQVCRYLIVAVLSAAVTFTFTSTYDVLASTSITGVEKAGDVFESTTAGEYEMVSTREDSYYKIECWGEQGQPGIAYVRYGGTNSSDVTPNGVGGKSNYCQVIVRLKKGDVIKLDANDYVENSSPTLLTASGGTNYSIGGIGRSGKPVTVYKNGTCIAITGTGTGAKGASSRSGYGQTYTFSVNGTSCSKSATTSLLDINRGQGGNSSNTSDTKYGYFGATSAGISYYNPSEVESFIENVGTSTGWKVKITALDLVSDSIVIKEALKESEDRIVSKLSDFSSGATCTIVRGKPFTLRIPCDPNVTTTTVGLVKIERLNTSKPYIEITGVVTDKEHSIVDIGGGTQLVFNLIEEPDSSNVSAVLN